MNKCLEFRNTITNSDSLAFGCSHTWGTGVEDHETWSFLLGAKNYGVGGSSSDHIIRIASSLIAKERPQIVYCLWPDWSRFEYIKNGQFYQSLPTDPDRIKFMPTHDDDWCRSNFSKNLSNLKKICAEHDARLIDMTLYDLIPFIDHADRWPVSKLGHHYAPEWHRWVANLFLRAREENFSFPLSDE
jgi:hypothetical protein